MMSTRSVEYVELQSLLSLLCDDQISDGQRRRLFEILQADPEARRFYVDYLDLDASLRWDCADLGGERTRPCSTSTKEAGVFGRSVITLLGDAFRAGGEFLSRSFVLTLLLAIGLPGIVLVLLIVDVARQPVAKAPVPVVAAEVTDSLGCVLAECGADLPAGTKLFPDERVRLKEGLAELTFADGARVVLQGPATFRIDSGRGGRLDDGSLAATVPPPARGFTIETPFAQVVDLGTEFGVLVAPDGRTEAHVFVGKIDVATEASTPQAVPVTRHLQAGEAVEVNSASPGRAPQLVAMSADAGRFVRRLPQKRPKGLPEPTILFAHRGDTNPTTEGWRLIHAKGDRKDFEEGPYRENGTAAWELRSLKDDACVYYDICKPNQLTPKLMAEARQKGWVLRARIWIDDKYRCPGQSFRRLGLIGYRDGETMWKLRPSLDSEGNQFGTVGMIGGGGRRDVAFGPLPNSRGQYVDYELRYDPATKRLDLYVNGRHMTEALPGKRASDDDELDPDSRPSLRFGLWWAESHARFANVEWGILRENSAATTGVTEPRATDREER